MITTAFTELVGCRHPLQQAGMGGAATPALAQAVAGAGGLGMLAMSTASVDAVVDAVTAVCAGASGPVGINFLMPFLNRDVVSAAASAGARLVEFFYDTPSESLVEMVHAGGALAAWQVGSVTEARQAVDAGCDVVIAQGCEAGGHVRGTVGLLALLDDVLEAVPVPVVAAGGIGSGRSMAAVLAAGASAARLGTRFLAASEADVHPEYLELLIGAEADDTVLTEAFSVYWPDAPHRVLRSAVEAALAFDGDVVGETVHGGQRVPLPRLSVPGPTRATTGAIAAMALYAGQSVGAVRRSASAASIVASLVEEAERLLRVPRP
ncbi:MAG: hypothetical protein NVS3B12_30200 [Acidimicrobiales bacterium]